MIQLLRPSPRGFGEQGNKAIYFRRTREQKSNTEGNRYTKAILGNREHRKSSLDFLCSLFPKIAFVFEEIDFREQPR